MPAITVLLPIYNGLPYLKRCLESLSRQTHTDFEVVIADDGSSDGSQDLLRALSDPRFQVIREPGARGLFANLNRLARHARGQYVRILCQDDWLLPDCLKEEQAFLDAHPSVALLFTKYSTIDTRDEVIAECRLKDLPDCLPPSLSLQHFFYHGCIPSNLSTVTLRRTAFEKAGFFDESLTVSGDYDLWVRVCKTHDMGVLHQRLVRLRAHSGQLSNAKSSGVPFVKENRAIRAQILPLLPPEIRGVAARFERRRHFVLDLHYGLRAGATGRFAVLWGVLRALGLRNALAALGAWLSTGNNHWARPKAVFVLPNQAT